MSTDTANPQYYPTDVYARFVSTDGSLGSEFAVDVSDLESLFVGFSDEIRTSATAEWNLYGRFMDTNGNVSSRFVISDKPGNQHIPIPVFDGTKYLVTWMDGMETANVKSQAAFFDTNGKMGIFLLRF